MNNLNNFKFWSAELWTQATFNIFKGFSLNFSANVSFIQDQVTLIPERPEWSDGKVRIKLDEPARKGFFKKVIELEDQEGL